MTTAQILNRLLDENGGVLLASDAAKAGIARSTLSQLVKQRKLMRIARGLYAREVTLPDELHLLQQRSEKIIYSHETALYLHDMAERTPSLYTLSIPGNSKLSPSMAASCKVYYVKPEYHSLGRCSISSKMGHTVVAYNAERTVSDILRSRNRIDDQIVYAALKSYAFRKSKNWELLREYADIFRVSRLLRQYLGVLL